MKMLKNFLTFSNIFLCINILKVFIIIYNFALDTKTMRSGPKRFIPLCYFLISIYLLRTTIFQRFLVLISWKPYPLTQEPPSGNNCVAFRSGRVSNIFKKCNLIESFSHKRAHIPRSRHS